jgi:hypothetical protein
MTRIEPVDPPSLMKPAGVGARDLFDAEDGCVIEIEGVAVLT